MCGFIPESTGIVLKACLMVKKMPQVVILTLNCRCEKEIGHSTTIDILAVGQNLGYFLGMLYHPTLVCLKGFSWMFTRLPGF